jgi:acetylornithine deacetylase/succinyl-diaminopimelate desuccinylase-like protein
MFRRRAQLVIAAGVAFAIGCAGAARSTTPTAPASPVTAHAPPDKPAAPSGTSQGAACPPAQQLDAAQLEQEAVCLLRQYVQIDTSNPPGNELAAAAFLRGLLEREGIPVTVVESAPGRGNLLARWPNTAKPLIALAHHMDVVPAVASAWSVPPFAATLRDGMLWGRGALDDKAGGIVSLLTLLMAKRLGIELPYDTMFLALADEEAGGGVGARDLLAKHPELVRDVKYVMNEGGGIMELPDTHVLYQIEVAQKAPLWLRLTARGPAGHGSAPSANTATARLVRALARLADHNFPIEVLPEVQALYARKAPSLAAPLREGARDLRKALARADFRAAFLHDAHHAALVRNTLAISMLHGSDKENVIPGEASAVLDMRLLPGQDASKVQAEIVKLIADPAIEVQTLLSWTAHSSARDTPLFRAIEARAQTRDPGAQVLANVIGGFTDCNAFRAHGITCYGFMPLRLAPDAFAGIHGNDERIRTSTLGEAVIAWLELLRSVDASAGPER